MHTKSREAGKKNITILLFAILLGVLAAAAFPLQRSIARYMEELRREAVVYLENFFGRSIGYDSISPSIFRFIEIRGLVIYKEGESFDPLLAVSKVRAYYRFRSLLHGDREHLLREISIENSSFSLDLMRDEDLMDLLSMVGEGSPSFPDITISGRNLNLEIINGSTNILLEKLFFEFKPSGERLKVQIKCAGSTIDPLPGSSLSEGMADIRISGNADRDFTGADLTVRLSDLSTSLFDMRNVTIHADKQGKKITLRKIQDKSPFDLTLIYDIGTGDAEISFNADGFMPYTYITPGEPLSALAPWFTSVISGKANLRYSMETGAADYNADVNVHLDNRLLPTVFDAAVVLDGDLTGVRVKRSFVTSEYGRWFFRGFISLKEELPIPEGILSVEDVPVGGSLLDSIMTVSREDKMVHIAGSDTRLGDITLEKTSIDLVPYKDDFDFSVAAYLVADDTLPIFSGEGNLQFRPDLFIQASAVVERLPVAPAADVFSDNRRLLTIADPLQFSSQFFFSTDLERFSFTTSRAVFTDRDNPDNSASFSLSGNNAGIDLSGVAVHWNGSELNGKASIHQDEEGINGVLDFIFRDTPYKLTALWSPDGLLTLEGYYNLTGNIQTRGSSHLFRCTCEKFPIPLDNETVYASLKANGNFGPGGDWEVLLTESLFEGLPMPIRENRLSLSARADRDQITLYRIGYADSLSSVTGNGVMDISLIRSRGSGWLELSDLNRKERYSLIIGRDEDLSASLRISYAPMARFSGGNISGLANGILEIHGDPQDPEITLDVAVESGEFNGDPFSGSIHADYRELFFNCSDLNLRFMNNNLEHTECTYDLSDGQLIGRSSLHGIMGSETMGAELAFAVQTGICTSFSDIPRVMNEDMAGSLTIDKIRKGETMVSPWTVFFSTSQGNFHIQGGPDNSMTADIRQDKSFTLTLTDPLPIRGTAAGQIDKSHLTADLTDLDLDVLVLDTIMRLPQFKFLEGNAQGFLKVSGSFNDPEIWGTLNATDIVAENPYVQEKIGPFDCVLSFEEKTLAIRDTILTSGKSRAVADVTFVLDHWVTDNLDIDLQTLSREGIHISHAFGRMNVDGYMLGHLNIRGDSTVTHLSGDVEALSTVVTIKNPEDNGETRRNAKKFFTADLNIAMGKGVEFLWPTRKLPVLRTFAETGKKLKVRYDGTRDQFNVQGEVDIKGGQIYYVQRNFYIREGTISFNENQDKFDPILSTTAEIREIDEDGESIKVYLIVDEKPLSSFQPRFESDPVMSTSDILALLGGQLFYASDSGEGMDFSQAIAITGDFVGQFGILSTFEERVKSIFNIDLFTIRTPVVSNLLLDKVLTSGGDDQFSESESLGKYLDNTTLFLGKYFGNDLFLQAILRLDFYDQFSGGLSTSNEMFLDTEITVEWKTPITLVEFSLFPDLTAEEGDILNPSLGLSWRYSY